MNKIKKVMKVIQGNDIHTQGSYNAIWSGYTVIFSVNEETYELTMEDRALGFKQCTVHIDNEGIYVTT